MRTYTEQDLKLPKSFLEASWECDNHNFNELMKMYGKGEISRTKVTKYVREAVKERNKLNPNIRYSKPVQRWEWD